MFALRFFTMFVSPWSLTKVKHDLTGFTLFAQPSSMDAALWKKRRSSRWNLASNSLSDDKEKSMLHFPQRHPFDLLHSPLGATVILSSAENVLKK